MKHTEKDTPGYWQENIRLVKILLSVWLVISFLLGIVFVDLLDNIRFAGFKLGFWLSQQGAIFIYVLLIYIYLKAMDKLDNKYKVNEKD
jgi:putative solute:sodium symporter small subunit